MRALALVVLAGGCSSLLGIDDLEGPSATSDGGTFDGAGPVLDTPVDVPDTLRISGTIQHLDGTGQSSTLPNAQVSIIDNATVVLAAGSTDANGKFELTIATDGRPVDGAIQASGGGARPTRSYFSQPATGDVSNAVVQVFDDAAMQTIANACASNFVPSLPVVFAFVFDAQGSPSPNAPIESSPTTKWCGQNMDGTISMEKTGDQGFAFGFSLPAGPILVRSGVATRLIDAPQASTIFVSVRTP